MRESLAIQRVAVLYGGSSAERDVSLVSGRNVAEVLKARGHVVELVDTADQPVTTIAWSQFDIAFISLHGTYGEDGQVQSELDRLGVRYTGSNASASALAFDKIAAKHRFLAHGVATPKFEAISKTDSEEHVHQLAQSVGYPLVVKPNAQGSSVGVTIVEQPEQLSSALRECFHFDDRGLLETAVIGTEWTVGLVGQQTLTPIRIDAERRFYDYLAKYHDEATSYHLADESTDKSLINSLQNNALQACESLGTSGVARVDFRLDESGHPWALEVNTIPGFTGHSLLPMAAADCGMNFGVLCEQIILEALRQTGRRLAG